jgi:hypothetical protein
MDNSSPKAANGSTEKIDPSLDRNDLVEETMKNEAADDNGEVFNQAEFRALGW